MSREISEAQRAWLVRELDAWRAEGIVSEPAVKAVLALYATPLEAQERRYSKALLTLLALAGLMVGVGIFLLIGYNWEAMPAAAKIILILSGVITAHSVCPNEDGVTRRAPQSSKAIRACSSRRV